MPDDITAPDAGADAGDGAAAGGDQGDTVDNVVDDNATDDSTDSPTEGDEVDEEAEAAALLAEGEQGDKPEGADKDPPAEGTDDAGKEKVVAKSISEARAHIERLEKQVAPLEAMQAKVLEIGGMPVLEMMQPLIDVAINPEATSGQIIEAVAAVNGQNPQDLAWGLVDENRASVVAHFCGDAITPEILEQLVDKFEKGEIDLDDADDVFLTADEKADKAAAAAKDKPNAAEKEAQETALSTARNTAVQSVGKLCEDSVNSVLAPYAIKDDDSDDVKGLKGFINQGVQAQVMFALSQDPVFNRVQKLIQNNGVKAADALARGALAVKIQNKTEELMKGVQPFVDAAIGKAQAAAKKIKTVRDEPSGASTQADVIPKREELSAKDPKWRDKLDAQLDRDLAAIQAKNKKQRRSSDGTYI